MEEKESNVSPGSTDAQPSKNRLVIRVVIPQEPAPQTKTPSGWNTRAIALAVVVVAAAMLIWLGFNRFSSDPSVAIVAGEEPAKVDARSHLESQSDEAAHVVTDETPAEIANPAADAASVEDASDSGTSTNETLVSSAALTQAEEALLPINQVIPDVPRSALQTIRGTIRVTVQVNIAKEGTVLAVTSKVPGPSRYFERLSVEAARKWTFTPSISDTERIMLIRFHYTREGATAHTNVPGQQDN